MDGSNGISYNNESSTSTDKLRYPRPFAFDKAKSTCENSHATLITIDSELDGRFLASMFNKSASLWIGLERNEHGGWVWFDQSPVSYTAWLTDEPDSTHNCAVANELGFWKTQEGIGNEKVAGCQK